MKLIPVDNKRVYDVYNKFYADKYEIVGELNITKGTDELTLYCPKHNYTFNIKARVFIKTNKSKYLCKKCKNDAITYTQEEFRELAKKSCPQYDYSESVYINNYSPVIVRCPKHGYFEVKAAIYLTKQTHRIKNLCPYCQKENNTQSNEEFLSKLNKEIFEKYEFDEKFNYIDSKTEVIVKCKQHGYFTTTPKLLMMYGQKGFVNVCPMCQSNRKFTDVEEIKKIAENNYGDKYTFDKITEYKGRLYPLIVTCKKHGDFKTNFGYISLNRRENLCPICCFEKSHSTNVIKNAKKRFGDRYDFSESVYIDSTTPIKVRCPKHGYFYIEPYKLTEGDVYEICPECYKEGKWLIERMHKRFPNKYETDEKFNFISLDENVTIICKEHGYIDVSPMDILY